MNTAGVTPLPAPGTTDRTWRGFVSPRAIGVAVLVWSLIAAIQTLAQYIDLSSIGQPKPVLVLVRIHLLMYAPWLVFSLALHGVLRRTKHSLTRVPVAVGLLLVFSLAFMPANQLYTVALHMFEHGVPWNQFLAKVQKHPVAFVFFDYFIFVGTFAFIYAMAVFQRSLHDERQRQRVEAENLALRLEVEQGRMVALRAQLEPHFLFNALNALSALVRGGDQLNALKAVQRLSELLRYAISASGRDWMTIAEELAFIEDYLALQRLRFGPRLAFQIEGYTPELRNLECPPLLLQPLVENALRHDLENGSETSDIRIGFALDGDCVEITVSNPARDEAEHNRGMGIGLRNIAGRLALVYGDRATLRARRADGRFVVGLRLPLEASERAA